MQNVPERRSRRGGHYSDASWKSRQAALPLEREETLGSEFRLEALELALEGTDAGFLQVLDDELIVATRLINAYAATRQNLLPGLRREPHTHIPLAKHRATELRVPIFHREIPVAGRGHREIRQLSLDPEHA